MKTLNDSEKPVLRQLFTILRDTKGMKATFNKNTRSDDVPHYIVTVHCHVDHVLVRLGKTPLCLPRGLHIVWVPGHPIEHIAGFLPKFENDDRGASSEVQVPQFGAECTKLDISLKYSGSLGLFLAYTLPDGDGEVRFTAFSKNSADSSNRYVSANVSKMEELVSANPALPHEMLKRGMSVFCAEVMYEDDQTHGSRLQDGNPSVAMVVTAAFRSFLVAREMEMQQLCPVHPDWKNQAVHLGLPVDLGYSVSMHDAEAVRNLFSSLSARRDRMDFSELDSLLEQYRVRAPEGSPVSPVSHLDLLGQVLEGLVITAEGRAKGDILHILKYKFANYTVRTMALRSLFDAFDKSDVSDPDRTSLLSKCANSFCERWCTTPDGRRHWFRAIISIGRARLAGALQLKLQKEEGVGEHILAMELYEQDPDWFAPFLDDLDGESLVARWPDDDVDAVAIPRFEKTLNVVVVVGPIGSGKTTFMNRLVEYIRGLGTSACAVDGDEVGGRYTLQLGPQRGPVTQFHILQAALRGDVPVVSCGGGVLFDHKDGSLTLAKAAAKLGFGLSLCLVLATGDDASTAPPDPRNDDAVRALYDATGPVRDCVSYRIREKIWSPVDPGLIASKSQANYQFYSKLSDMCNEVFTDRSDMSAIFNAIDGSNDAVETPIQISGQLRYLTLVKGAKASSHITLEFGNFPVSDLDIQPTDEDVQGLVVEASVVYPADAAERAVPQQQQQQQQADVWKKEKKAQQKRTKRADTVRFVWIPSMFPSAHVTQTPGPFRPAQMKDLALAMSEGRISVDLPVSNDASKVLCVRLPNRDTCPPTSVKLVIGPYWIV
jgi:hypothetical protein